MDIEVQEEQQQQEEEVPRPTIEGLQGRILQQMQMFAVFTTNAMGMPSTGDSMGFSFDDADGNTVVFTGTMLRLNKGARIGNGSDNHLDRVIMDTVPEGMLEAREKVAEFQKRVQMAQAEAARQREQAEAEEHQEELVRGN